MPRFFSSLPGPHLYRSFGRPVNDPCFSLRDSTDHRWCSPALDLFRGGRSSCMGSYVRYRKLPDLGGCRRRPRHWQLRSQSACSTWELGCRGALRPVGPAYVNNKAKSTPAVTAYRLWMRVTPLNKMNPHKPILNHEGFYRDFWAFCIPWIASWRPVVQYKGL